MKPVQRSTPMLRQALGLCLKMVFIFAVLCASILPFLQKVSANSPVGTLYLVLFDPESTSLNEANRPVLDQVIADFNLTGNASLIVTGHYDRTGSSEHRAEMSERMAETVANYLLENGVPKKAMTVLWAGDSQPMVDTADGAPESANRRVEITFVIAR